MVDDGDMVNIGAATAVLCGWLAPPGVVKAARTGTVLEVLDELDALTGDREVTERFLLGQVAALARRVPVPAKGTLRRADVLGSQVAVVLRREGHADAFTDVVLLALSRRTARPRAAQLRLVECSEVLAVAVARVYAGLVALAAVESEQAPAAVAAEVAGAVRSRR